MHLRIDLNVMARKTKKITVGNILTLLSEHMESVAFCHHIIQLHTKEFCKNKIIFTKIENVYMLHMGLDAVSLRFVSLNPNT